LLGAAVTCVAAKAIALLITGVTRRVVLPALFGDVTANQLTNKFVGLRAYGGYRRADELDQAFAAPARGAHDLVAV
jgi:hypothetical protein